MRSFLSLRCCRLIPAFFLGLAALVAVGLSTSSAAATVQSPGIVEAIEDVVIRSTVPGTIDRYAFDEGGRVQPQEVVVILENRLQQLEVARRKLIWESLVELEAARAQLELAQNDLEATRKLFETTQSVSREELDLKALDARLAQAEVDRFQVAEEREKIEFEIAEEQLNLRLLKSPIKGIVTKHFMAAGETTEGQEPLVRIVDLSRCVLVSNVDATRIGRLHVGQRVEVVVQGGEDVRIQDAVVTFVSPVVDPSSGLQEVKAEFSNSEERIRPGLTGLLVFDPDPAPAVTSASEGTVEEAILTGVATVRE
ncbi:MAG: efflux RND transporter periplasmic adaptor subunit [Verrucomicrobiota bacterium]|nr:efflux RND transporter periplasmic adaptor subunit [Verrucomicrobiota bacterium]MDD8050112.1 efflux RND transporter periplasmic adaptor subunit [Verrucomicrobiota bacterium]